MAATLCGSPMYMVGRTQLCMLGNFARTLSSADFFFHDNFKKKSFRNTVRVSLQFGSRSVSDILPCLIWGQTIF